MKNAVGILGVGEIGASLVQVLQTKYQILKKDIDYDEFKGQKVCILHICIPYTSKFISEAIRNIKQTNPKLVVIDSTVAVGTTAKIFQKTQLPIVHSPVMGTHPNLARDLKVFTKIIGPVNDESAKLAQSHFQKIGIKTITLTNSEESELGKLLDTTYFGWNVLFCKLVGKLCEENGWDYSNVYTKFNQIYNQGYSKSKPNVIRPVLEYKHPKDQNGGIGGHCVIPNAHILESQFKPSFVKFLLSENEKLKRAPK